MQNAATERDLLVDEIEAHAGVLPEAHRRALLAVDRARYVREVDRAHAWRNMPLPLDTPHAAILPSVDALIAEYGSYQAALSSGALADVAATISAPAIYAAAFDLLGLQAGHRLLELGTGTGYGAALGAQIVGQAGCVTTVEVDPALVLRASELTRADNVHLLHDDGLRRPDLVAAHDRICVTFAIERVPQPLLDALGDGSVLIAPVGIVSQTMLRYRRVGGRLEVERTIPVRFIAAREFVAS
jgi:protein-L-isoaspartate(D-aspartate) O-methyltransferase